MQGDAAAGLLEAADVAADGPVPPRCIRRQHDQLDVPLPRQPATLHHDVPNARCSLAALDEHAESPDASAQLTGAVSAPYRLAQLEADPLADSEHGLFERPDEKRRAPCA